MKSFAILCFLLLASACIFAVRAEEETTDVDAPKADEQPELAANSDEEAPETTDDEEDEEDNQADEETEGDEEESDEEGEELDADEQEKRGLTPHGSGKCIKWRHGQLLCTGCGCRRVCKIKYCKRHVCTRYQCGYRTVCKLVTRYRIVRRYVKVNVGSIYYPKYIYKWITKRVAYHVKVCKSVPKFCTRCIWQSYACGQTCRYVCRYQKCVANKYRG